MVAVSLQPSAMSRVARTLVDGLDDARRRGAIVGVPARHPARTSFGHGLVSEQAVTPSWSAHRPASHSTIEKETAGEGFQQEGERQVTVHGTPT